MGKNLSPHVWILQDLDTQATHAFDEQHIAQTNAERIVGNRAAAFVGGSEMMIL